MSDHASLSPSSAYRWFVCPGSVAATAGMPDSSNVYAREGTAAHTLGERCLNTGIDAAHWIGTTSGRIRVDYEEDGKQKHQFFEVDREMSAAVQIYVDYCREIASKPSARMLVEQRVGLAPIDPELSDIWGTSDCCIYVPEEEALYVIDYKHGSGKVVDVEDNLQLKIYALAAWATFNDKFKLRTVIPVIVQPRAGGEAIRTTEYSAAQLFDFIEDCVEAVHRARDPAAPLVPGSHCDFCKLKGTCKAWADKAVVEAQAEFPIAKVPQQLTLEQAAALLEKAEHLEDWIKGVRQYLHDQAERGVKVPGYKLIPKRATRQWRVGEQEVVDTLAPLVAVDDELYKKELLSPAQMEKVVGKKNLPEDLIVKISSGNTLVKESNPTPELTLHPGDDFDIL